MTTSEQLRQDLARAGYARDTQRRYASDAGALVNRFKKSASKIGRSELRSYVEELHATGLSASRIKHHLLPQRSRHPPHPASPPTKKPLVALMKQARAFGVGVVVATQNPMVLDYRALSNAGLWCLGRLQTDADRTRVIEGLANEAGIGESEDELAAVLKQIVPR